jgi:ATP-dependent RNA helicase SUPV3L1/SUV3
MFQAGEVDAMVATDAIGMGLNLDLAHVAFADLRKYDGRQARELELSELAQIAGRAGRYVRDGTFGTLAPLPSLPPTLVEALEQHRVPSVRRLVWRNDDLDFTSIEALVRSLKAEPTRKLLRRIDRAEDHDALVALASLDEVRGHVRGAEAVARLWEIASVPDFRQLLFEDHVRLLARFFAELTGPRGRLDPEGVHAELSRIEKSPTDIETLMDRIAEIRLWNYVAHQPGWLASPSEIQERARAVEDRLSDALHAALVSRFVEVTRTTRAIPPAPRSSERGAPLPSTAKAVPAARGSSPFAALAGLRDKLGRGPDHDRESAGARVLPERELVEALVEASHEDFAVDPRGVVSFGGRAVGRLAPGRDLLSPELVVTLELDAGARLRVARRLTAFGRDLVTELVGPLRDVADDDRVGVRLSSWGRGLVHLLERRLGTVLASEASAQLTGLEPGCRARLERAGVVLGAAAVYVPELLKPRKIERRAALASAYLGTRANVAWPTGHEVSGLPERGVEEAIFGVVGYPVVAGRAVRADVLERAVQRLARSPEASPDQLGSWLGCRGSEARRIREALAPAIALAAAAVASEIAGDPPSETAHDDDPSTPKEPSQ